MGGVNGEERVHVQSEGEGYVGGCAVGKGMWNERKGKRCEGECVM